MLKGISSRGELELATAKLQRIFSEPHYQFGRPVNLDFIAGFTQVEDPPANRDGAIREAAQALRQARRTSRCFDLYAPQRTINAEEERKLLQRLPHCAPDFPIQRQARHVVGRYCAGGIGSGVFSN